MLAASAVPRVTISAPVPPVTVSVLAMVAVLAKAPRVRASLPTPRSMLALATAAPNVMLSLPEPPVTVSVFETEALLVPLANISVSLPAPRSTLPFTSAVPRVIASAPEPPISVVTFLTVPVLAVLARVSLLAPVPRSTEMAVVSAVPKVRGQAKKLARTEALRREHDFLFARDTASVPWQVLRPPNERVRRYPDRSFGTSLGGGAASAFCS